MTINPRLTATMKSKANKDVFGLALLAGMGLHCSTAFAQSTAFTYQGRLDEASQPATDRYDFGCQIYDEVQLGTRVSTTAANSPVRDSKDLFALNRASKPESQTGLLWSDPPRLPDLGETAGPVCWSGACLARLIHRVSHHRTERTET